MVVSGIVLKSVPIHVINYQQGYCINCIHKSLFSPTTLCKNL